MADVPTTAKKPTDRKPKKGLDDVPDVFSFSQGEVEYKFDRPTADVITPGWLRRHRRSEELDGAYSAIEQLASDDVLDVLDNMDWTEHRSVLRAFSDHVQAVMGASAGESPAS